ncbi:MAG: NfeD family protein [bacterium]|nr:NfeD family protein [bacterium]
MDFDMIEIWWIWMGLAALFLIAEIFTAGFFLLCFSFGAAAAGVLAMLDVGYAGQFIVFILVSGITFVFSRRFAESVTIKQPPGIGADRMIEKIGVVFQDIDNTTNTGRVRIGQDDWRASSEDGEAISKGSKVQVVKIDGSRAIVIKLEEE